MLVARGRSSSTVSSTDFQEVVDELKGLYANMTRPARLL